MGDLGAGCQNFADLTFRDKKSYFKCFATKRGKRKRKEEEKEEGERKGKRKRKEKEERESGKRKRKEKKEEERERGKRKRKEKKEEENEKERRKRKECERKRAREREQEKESKRKRVREREREQERDSLSLSLFLSFLSRALAHFLSLSPKILHFLRSGIAGSRNFCYPGVSGPLTIISIEQRVLDAQTEQLTWRLSFFGLGSIHIVLRQ